MRTLLCLGLAAFFSATLAACGATYADECEAECTAANDTSGACGDEDKSECTNDCAALTNGRSDVCAACLFTHSEDMAVNPDSGRCLQPNWEDPTATLCDDECA